ncbi:MAG: hypothetical protein WKG07_36625 [Hymenobacter sp.]
MLATPPNATRPTRSAAAWLVPALTLTYALLSYRLLGFHSEQLVLVVLVNGCYFASGLTRRLITGFSIFLVYWVLYDYMRLFPTTPSGRWTWHRFISRRKACSASLSRVRC